MIPKNAIKKVRNEIHLEIAAGSLLAYGVFPQTSEGIQKAKETAASKDTWLAPSDLPEYYDGIDSDLLTGKENDAIRAIRKTLKEFYGISSAGTEDYVDTRSSRPAVPAGIQITWFSVTQVGPTTWEKLKAQLTGKGYFSEVNLSEKDADELIANIKKSGEFPSLKDQSGIHNEVYQNWLVDTYLPNYGKTQVYTPGDKFVDDGKEFIDEILDNAEKALEEKSNEIMDAIDAVIAADTKKYEDFKKQLERKVDHPKLYPELQKINPRYMWGQNGLYDLEFKSDIDRAIYFAGKLSSKDTPDKVAVRAWLKDVTELDVREDYEEIKDYRNKILALILQLIKLNPQEREVIVPPVYDGYYQDPPEEDEDEIDEDEIDDEEYDDLYGSSLDDLLAQTRESTEDNEDVEDQIEQKKEELEDAAEEDQIEDDDEGDIGSEDDIPDEVFDENIDPSVLEEIINKRKGKTGTKEKKSYYVSNTKLLQGITKSLAAVTGQLDQVNQSLLEQNQLIQTNIDLNLASLEALQAQDDILTTKFDAILNAFQQQYEASQKAEEDAKRLRAEQRLEEKTIVAGTEDPKDLTGGGKGGKGGRAAFIRNYFARRFARRLYRKVPKGLRRVRTKARKIQRIPGKLQQKAIQSATNRLPQSAQSIMKGLGAAKTPQTAGLGKRLPGVRQALAVWEYGERKKEGQSDFQALSGIGAGLAGAAAGGAAGAKLGTAAGAAIGLAFGGVGAAPGALIGGILGGILGIAGGFIGGSLASGAADKLTGADQVGQDQQYEKGTDYAKPGTAMLHGTELLIDKDKDKEGNMYGVNTVGATLIAATSKFINGLGPAGSAVAPLFEQKAAPLIQLFGAPATTAQTNVGGGFPSIGSIFKKAEKKKESFPDEYEGMSREEIEILQGNSESFAEKLLKMIDPEDKFKNFLDGLAAKIRNPFTPLEDYDGTGIEGDLKGNIVNPMEQGELQDYPGAKFGAPRSHGTHKGRDIIGPKGMKFVAAMPGKVTQIINVGKLPNGGWSKGIYVKHDNGMETRYLHVTPSVKVGDAVKAGQKLGVLTEKDDISSVAHLHFELLVNGRHVDPDKAGNSILKKAYKLADIQAGKVPGLSLDPSGKTPLETYDGTPAGGQAITQNFGMETGQERMFTSGGKQYKAHKTEKGFEFFDGMTRLDTTSKDEKGNVKNAGLVRDFVAQQTQAMYAPPKAESIQMLNKFETGEQEQLIVINQQKAPALPTGFSNIQFEQVGGQWRSTKEYDVKVIEKLRLSLQ